MIFRVPPGIKARFRAYARSRGLSLNAAGIVFLDEHLPAEPDSAPKRGTRLARKAADR